MSSLLHLSFAFAAGRGESLAWGRGTGDEVAGIGASVAAWRTTSKLLAYNFETLGVSSAWDVHGMHPGPPSEFRLQSNTLHAFQREICCNVPFKLLLMTHLKELFTKQREILSCKSVKPCKNRKNSRAYYVRTRDKTGSNSPLFQHNVQIPPSPGTMHSQMPGVCPGGDVEVSN